MRAHVAFFLAATISAALNAQTAARVEYGRAVELRNVKSVFVSAGADDLGSEARRQLAAALPALAFASAEQSADVTLSIQRTLRGDKRYVTSAEVVRTGTASTRLYADATSSAADLNAALQEVIVPFVYLLQGVNPERFGAPPAGAGPSAQKQLIHSTAGLRPGLTKREVLAAFGTPTQMSGAGTFQQTWIYRTGDGDVRLVFGGDMLAAITVPQK